MKIISTFILLLIPIFISQEAFGATTEIRKLTPPKLDEAHLGRKILGYRPMRKGSPNMSIEITAEKIVAHNYGHGGSGWTLAPGSALYVIDLLEKHPSMKNIAKNTPITVIGAGALGLFSAFELHRRGYANITIVAEHFDNLTSHLAGGSVMPSTMKNDNESAKIVEAISYSAYNFYAEIVLGKNKLLRSGVAMIPAYTSSRDGADFEPYVKAGIMQPAKDVLVDFGDGILRSMVVYDDALYIDPEIMMQTLHDYLQPYVTFKQYKVNDFSVIQDPIIVNCSGLGAKELNHDDSMVSVQGHLILLKNQAPETFSYMMTLPAKKTIAHKNGQTIKYRFYLYPKTYFDGSINEKGTFGGTFIEGATQETPNEEEFNEILQNAQAFFHSQQPK